MYENNIKLHLCCKMPNLKACELLVNTFSVDLKISFPHTVAFPFQSLERYTCNEKRNPQKSYVEGIIRAQKEYISSSVSQQHFELITDACSVIFYKFNLPSEPFCRLNERSRTCTVLYLNIPNKCSILYNNPSYSRILIGSRL